MISYFPISFIYLFGFMFYVIQGTANLNVNPELIDRITIFTYAIQFLDNFTMDYNKTAILVFS